MLRAVRVDDGLGAFVSGTAVTNTAGLLDHARSKSIAAAEEEARYIAESKAPEDSGRSPRRPRACIGASGGLSRGASGSLAMDGLPGPLTKLAPC